MAKKPATGANTVVSTHGQGGAPVSGAPTHGVAPGFAGLGASGDSDDTTLTPATRNSKGYPTGHPSFAGGDSN